MLTLNEIRNVNFRKSNFGGYRAEDVEAFIDEVQLSYDALLRENAELVKKLEVLASRIAEYQNEEEAIRNALMNAQKVADASLRDAKHKAEIMLKDATIKAERIVANAQTEIHREREIIDRMQKDIADFKARLLKAYKDHLTLINNLPTGEILSAETRDMSDSVVMLDRKAAAPFSQQPNMPAQQPPQAPQMQQPPMPQDNAQRPPVPQMPPQGQPMPRPQIVQPRPATEQPMQENAQNQQAAPIPPANEKPQRKDGFTVNIGDDPAEAARAQRGVAQMQKKPRFPEFDDAPDDGAKESQQPDMSQPETAPSSFFRRRNQ